MNKKSISPYTASITGERFLFYELRITAELMLDGLSQDEIIDRIVKENLFQYPTESAIKRMAKCCIKRLNAINSDELVNAIVTQPVDIAKQIALYAMMKKYRIVWDFMITVIGEKYRLKDLSFGDIDVNSFLFRLQDQNENVANWSDTTVKKIKTILVKILVETEYLDNIKSEKLNLVWLNSVLENAIKTNGDAAALVAFNSFS